MKSLWRQCWRLLAAGLLISLCSPPLLPSRAGGIDLEELQEKLEKAEEVREYLEDARDVAEALKPWTYPEERATGQVVAAQVAFKFNGVWRGSREAEAWTRYVNLVGRGLVPYCPRPDIKYRFAILDTDEVNAFAAPGGYIFVTRGILKLLNNEANLAGVLGHEIGHVAMRHAENTVKTMKFGGVAIDKGLKYAARDGKIDYEAAELAKEVGKAIVNILVNTGYSKKQEMQSDKVGTETIAKMGYSPYGLMAFLKKLDKMSKGKDSKLKRMLASHPALSARKDKLKEFIEKKGLKKKGGQLLEDRYQQMLQNYPIP